MDPPTVTTYDKWGWICLVLPEVQDDFFDPPLAPLRQCQDLILVSRLISSVISLPTVMSSGNLMMVLLEC